MIMCPAKTGSDRHSTSRHTDTNFLIASSVPAFYQHILSGASSYQELGNRVLRQIEAAYAFRQVEQVRELAHILVNIPIREYQLIGQYYFVWCKCREREYRPTVLEHIAEHSRIYRVKALVSRAGFDMHQGNIESALYFYTEALKTNPTISDAINTSTAIATLKSIEGFSASALRDIESLIPLLRHADPLTAFYLMNAYAIELIQHDRLNEAESVLERAVRSPFAVAYPELQDTRLEIRSKRKRHSTIAFSRPAVERVYQPETVVIDDPIREARVDAVIDYMKENLHEKIRLDRLCRIADLSDSRLTHVFKAQTGLPPIEYLIKLRMEKASHLLATTFEDVKIIMAKVGYGNRHHFLQLFREHFNTTPTAYRKRAMSQRRRY